MTFSLCADTETVLRHVFAAQADPSLFSTKLHLRRPLAVSDLVRRSQGSVMQPVPRGR